MPRGTATPIKTVLLGGSNSVLAEALSTGLEEKTSLANFGLGATTVMQNLYQVVRHEEAVIKADLVISESNVNDIGCLKYFGGDMDFVRTSIDLFYAELSRIQPNCLILLLPQQPSSAEPQDVIDAINGIHAENADRHGFMMIDFNEILAVADEEDRQFLRLDHRHPLNSYMYHLGSNIGQFIVDRWDWLQQRRADHTPSISSPFTILPPSAIPGLPLADKSNSRFRETVGTIVEDFAPPPVTYGKRLIGIGTWSDKLSAIKIASGDTLTIKPVNDINAFNELPTQPILRADTRIGSFYGTMADITEESILLTRRSKQDQQDEFELAGVADAFTTPVGLTGLLLMDAGPSRPPRTRDAGRIDLSSVAPRPQPYLRTMKDYIRRKRLFPVSKAALDRIIGSADRLADHDPEEARKLLKIALSIDPKNERALAIVRKIKKQLALRA